MRAPLTACLSSIVVGTLAAINVAAASDEILDAARRGDQATVLELLSESGNANAASNDGTTVLHWAVRHDDQEMITQLIAAGADASARNRYGISPLYLAAENGSAAAIGKLLEAGADPNEASTEGETLLMTVARTGAVDAATVLLEHGAEVDARETWHGQTALMWASGYGHPDLIDLLVSHGADPNAVSAIEQWDRQVTAEPRAKWLPPGGMTPLLFAAREDCLRCIPRLIAAGANIDATTPDGISAVVLALINGHYDVAAALVEAGTDPKISDYTGRTALYAAIDFNTMPSSNRPAPYVLENQHSALDVAKLLLERGADVNAQLTSMAPYRAKLDRGNDTALRAGTTALMRAAKAGDLAAMRVLIDAGADVSFATDRGATALLLAAGVGTTEQDTTGRFKTEDQAIAAIELLVEHGADINAVDMRGRSALHGAALQGYNDVIRYLASQGVDLNGVDQDGYTALDTALGLAGGFGFSGAEGIVREDTAAIIEELLAASE